MFVCLSVCHCVSESVYVSVVLSIAIYYIVRYSLEIVTSLRIILLCSAAIVPTTIHDNIDS